MSIGVVARLGGVVSEFELSRDEIRGMARSYTRAGQIKFLVRNGIQHYIDNNGWPVVLRSTVEGPSRAQSAPQKWKPNKAA